MARRKRSPRRSWVPRWLTHRSLLMTEAVLVVALVQHLVRDWMFRQPDVPGPLKVLFGMALIVGAFGWLVVFLHDKVRWGLKTTHSVAKRLPVPLPTLVVHLVALAALFVAYGWYWGLSIEPTAVRLVRAQWLEEAEP